jgi:ring-1,2-phenylacetyl-CoA epoxidase subunit PaaD
MSGLELDVHGAIAGVDDPEYPGISIVDLGLLERLDVTADGTVSVGLIPTFSGCPALAMIRDDVHAAVAAVPGVTTVDVQWLSAPTWSVDRIGPETRAAIGREFTVAVRIGTAAPACPRCGAPTTEQSMFGPSRCRSVNRCTACAETVEVMRS